MSETNSRNQIIAVIDDLFFASKIREAAKPLGLSIEFIKNDDGLVEKLESQKPSLLIFDLNSRACNPIDIIKNLKSSPALKDIPVLGYLSHVQTELKEEADKAGCDLVLARAKFSKDLKDILMKYARPHKGKVNIARRRAKVLNAILYGKQRGLEQELIQNFKVTEDFLTASTIERLLYLPDETLWAILSSPEIWKSQIIMTPGTLNPFPSGRNFWPKWKFKSGLKMVEPDCFIEFENVVVIIEAKRYDDGTQQYVEQLGKELIAYWEMSLQKPVMLLAIGGLADYSSKEIDKLREDINNYLKSQPSTLLNFSFSAVPWSELL